VSTAFPLLLVGRGVQGVANAFTTPLLLATIAATTPRERLGRSLGLFASMQAAGQTSAPLLGGLAAEATWRLAFVGVAVVAAALAIIGLPEMAENTEREPARLREVWRQDVLRAAAAGLVGWACLGGLSFLVAFRVDDGFGLGVSARGLLLTTFGVVGMATGRLAGGLIERTGARTGLLVGGLASAVPIGLIGIVGWLPAVALLWALAGFFAQFVQVGVNALVLTGTGANPAGAVSVVQSFRFVGAALSPLAFTPVYHVSAAAGFLLPAALLLAVTPLALLTRRRD
jgi:MFS family permease